MVSLKTLAAELGLSPTTVSRALNGYPEVNEKTRLRVSEAAKRLGYSPNMRARALATGRAMAIGHVLPVSYRLELVNPVFADFILGAGGVYARAGYDLILHIAPDDDSARAYREFRAKGNVDGVMVQSPSRNDPRIALLNELGLPFVVHGRASGVESPYSWTDVNNAEAFRELTAHLTDLGHRRIGLINGREGLDYADRRRAGYLDALHRAGINPDPALILHGELTEQKGAEGALRLLELPDPPTAIVTASVASAFGVQRVAQERGMEVGRDLSVACFDDDLSYLGNRDTGPTFTSVRSSVREAGEHAAQMLLELIADPARTPRQHLLEAELVHGSSTGPFPR